MNDNKPFPDRILHFSFITIPILTVVMSTFHILSVMDRFHSEHRNIPFVFRIFFIVASKLCSFFGGYRNVTFPNLHAVQLLIILEKLGRVKVWENLSPAGELDNYFFFVNKKLVMVIQQELEDVKLTAPKSVIASVQDEIEKNKNVGSNRG